MPSVPFRAPAPPPVRPDLSSEEAADLARTLYGIDGEAAPLPADRDQNFGVTGARGRYVLKIHRSDETAAFLEAQDRALLRLERARTPFRFPRVVPTREGARIGTVARPGRVTHLVRLVEWVEGTPLAGLPGRTPALDRGVGRILGTVDRLLVGFGHPAADRDFPWDPRRAGAVIDGHSGDGARPWERVRRFRRLFRERVEARAGELPLAVIHGDGNDHNVLAEDGEIVGLVDFGDLMRSWRVAEPAIGAAYALLDRDGDPLDVMAAVVEGYLSEHSLGDAELAAFLPLVAIRLCVSVVHSARRADERPDDPYLRISEAPAWRALERLERLGPDRAHERLRALGPT